MRHGPGAVKRKVPVIRFPVLVFIFEKEHQRESVDEHDMVKVGKSDGPADFILNLIFMVEDVEG